MGFNEFINYDTFFLQMMVLFKHYCNLCLNKLLCHASQIVKRNYTPYTK